MSDKTRVDGHYIVIHNGDLKVFQWIELDLGWGFGYCDSHFDYIAPEPLNLQKIKDSYEQDSK